MTFLAQDRTDMQTLNARVRRMKWNNGKHIENEARNGRWESTLTPFQWADPQRLPTVPGTPQVGKNFFLDEPCPV
jgi:hypothetical protein